MNLQYLGNRFHYLVLGAEIALNRALGREFIGLDRGPMSIEISSICNLRCRFCAYEKKVVPKVVMANEMFFDSVNQAVELGYDRFGLTPCTGDIFIDRQVFEKLAFLENHAQVKKYSFFTNLIIPSPEQLIRLTQLKKLTSITVSIYGHDEKSFIAITKSNATAYARLIANLKALLALREKEGLPFSLSFGWRSTGDVPKKDSSELMELLATFKKRGVHVNTPHGVFNNWGGLVSQEDVADLAMKIMPGDKKYKSGACVKLFDSLQITASGVVNACCCRDVNSTLKIGDIRTEKLRDILSPRNEAYLRIIKEQQDNRYSPICHDCDFYRSVYHQPSNFRRKKIPTQTIAQYLKGLE